MRHQQCKISSISRPFWRAHRLASAAKCAIEMLETRVLLSVNVTSYHYDLAETGANTSETILTPSNVNPTTFGKVASLPVDAQIYAQPLIMTGVSMSGGGTEDLVFVATENDSVYAFNAEGASTTPVWKVSLLQSGETAIPASVTGTNDITPIVGITSTPVINTASNTMYVEANFLESNGTYQQRLYQLNIATGGTVNDVIITGSVSGTGAGSSGGKVAFNALLENQRPALTLANGQVYLAFASHGDNGNYHGWVVAYNESTLAQDYVWCNTPNGSQGGIWMSGGGLAVDSSGDLYLTSGNGSFDANTGGSDYGMALVKLSPSLQALDYFSPYNEASLSGADQDYGCGNAILLSNQSGSAPNEAITLGKWGGVFLNNTATGQMGEINNPPNGPNKDLGQTGTNLEQHNTFAFWNGDVYIAPDAGTLRDYAVGNSTLGTALVSQSSKVFGSTSVTDGQGAGVSISSNGTSNGIVWALDNSGFNSSPAVLYAYNPSNLSQVYWASNQSGTRDTAGNAVKFTTPVVANGFVYVGGAGTLTLYSNIPPAPPPPPPPPPASSVTGFGNFTLNTNTTGVPSVSADSNTLTITTAAGSEATSAFFNTPAVFQNFTANFTYQETGTGPADGFAFVLQNSGSGVNAVGGSGGNIGYNGITPSFGVEFNIYQNSTTQASEDGNVNKNDNIPNTGAVNLRGGDAITVKLAYDSNESILTETLTDAKAGTSFTQLYTEVNLPTILGANTALLGFTGGTGGADALQTISNFTYTTSATAPLHPTPTLAAGATTASGFAGEVFDGVNDDNGVPAVSADNKTLTITNGNGTEQVLALDPTPVAYGDFNASFTYTEATSSSTAPADGITFTLQTQPVLGQQGGQLGYGGSVPNSFAVEFNIYQDSSTVIGAGGSVAVPYNASGNTGGVNLTSGDPIAITLAYSSANQTLTETLSDATAGTSDTITYNNVNLSQYLGNSPSAYVGFTGGTGGADATQAISGFSYTADTKLPAVQAGPQLNLTGYYTSYGIVNQGTAAISTGSPNGVTFPVPGGGTTGYDGGGNQLKESYIGSSTTVTDNGNTQTFNFAPVASPGVPDVITAMGQTINLPQGQYGNLSFLGSSVDGEAQNTPHVFTVNYTDGTSQSFTQAMSDWWYPGSTNPGEAVALTMPDHLDNTGTVQVQGGGPIDIYEYQFALNPAKTAESITLPDDMNVKLLAINVNAAPAVLTVSPSSGPAAGGTSVTITGTGFTGATAVDFGTTPASSFTVNSAGTQITALDPAGSGTVDVTVTGPYGTSPTTATDKFTYVSSNPISLTGVVVNGNNTALAGVQRSMVDSIVYTFNQAVNLGSNAFSIALNSTYASGTLATLTWTAINPNADGSSTQWVVTFSGAGVLNGSIADGVYNITLNGSAVSADGNPSVTGTSRTDTFYRLFGDATGSGSVSGTDYNALLSTFNLKSTAAGYLAYFNEDGASKIDAPDYNAFLANFGARFKNVTGMTTI
jgi:hypothetical protein